MASKNSRESTRRYIRKTYKEGSYRLRYDTERELIEALEASGLSASEVMKIGVKALIEQAKQGGE